MSTTAIIVEVLIIGFFATIWVILLRLRFANIEVASFKSFLAQIGTWSAPLLFVAAVVFYQLGLLMNFISHMVTKPFSQKQLRDRIIPGKDYEFVRAIVFQNGSTEILRDIILYNSFVRISRSGILIFYVDCPDCVCVWSVLGANWLYTIPSVFGVRPVMACHVSYLLSTHKVRISRVNREGRSGKLLRSYVVTATARQVFRKPRTSITKARVCGLCYFWVQAASPIRHSTNCKLMRIDVKV
jgi:hypothetical protein